MTGYEKVSRNKISREIKIITKQLKCYAEDGVLKGIKSTLYGDDNPEGTAFYHLIYKKPKTQISIEVFSKPDYRMLNYGPVDLDFQLKADFETLQDYHESFKKELEKRKKKAQEYDSLPWILKTQDGLKSKQAK